MKFNEAYKYSLFRICINEGRFTPPPKMVDEITDWADSHFPKIALSKKGIKKKFDVDLTGWKYEELFNDLKNDSVNVHLRGGDPKKGGSYDYMTNTITIYVQYNKDYQQAIRHELIHWAQLKSKSSRGSRKAMGLPSKNIRTPEVNQSGVSYPDYIKSFPKNKQQKERDKWRWQEEWEKEKKKELKGLKIKVSDLHSLDDEEFYSILDDRIYFFNKVVDDAKEKDFTRAEINGAIRNLINSDTVLNTIKKYSKSKWNKMVNEIIKEVL